MKSLRYVGMALSVVLISSTASASPPRESRAEYSADSTMEGEGGMTMKSRVYRTPDKERMEMGGAEGSITITRKDKKVRWQLFGNMYMESPLDQSNSSDMGDFQIIEQAEVGEETINGIKTAKSKVVAVKQDGSKFGGFFWTTKEGITVKMDLLSKEGEKKMRFTTELTNLKIERQDPALFEIPAGFTKNDMGAMMGQSMREMMGADQGQAPSRERRKPKTEESEPALDVNKMMKGLFGK